MVTMGSVQETTVAVSDGTIDDRLRPPLPQNGDHKRTPRGMSNGTIYGLIKSRMAAGRHPGKLQQHHAL